MAHDGFARAIVPSHTPGDGDTIFALATGRRDGEANVSLVGALAAEVIAEAIVRAVRQATSVAGIPAARDLGRSEPCTSRCCWPTSGCRSGSASGWAAA